MVLVPPEQSADLRDSYNKHTKTDRLDSRVLARLPLLHPEGLRGIDNLGPAGSLRRAVRHRSSLVKRRTGASLRLDALVELLGPGWADALGSATASKTALVVLEKYADPRALKRLGRARLGALLIRSSAGLWREEKADELLAMASETLALWSGGGIDFTELAHDIASEVRVLRQLDDEIAAADKRIAVLYDEADPKGVVRSVPGLGPVLSAAILGNAGDFNRFANLAGVRSFTGFVPKIDQSGLVTGHKGITKAGDAGLRQALYLAADHARHIDPTLAQRYYRLVMVEGKHHNSALCSVSAVLITRRGHGPRRLAARRGREIKTIGDGFLATFDATSRGRAGGDGGRGRCEGMGLDVRIGIHAGEVEVRPDDEFDAMAQISGFRDVLLKRMASRLRSVDAQLATALDG